MTDQHNNPAPTAAMVAIGDELLSGRTQDANMHYLAGWLTERGVILQEVRVVQDETPAIIAAVNALRGQVDYVFTSGGIGPTHDDITARSVAAAFGEEISIRADARKVLEDWYQPRGDEVTQARLRMARIPDKAALITNTITGAPGFRLENVFVMAGVPAIFQNMLEHVDDEIARGPVKQAVTIRGEFKESTLANALAKMQEAYPSISIGSYPGKTGRGPVSIVLRGTDKGLLDELAKDVACLMSAQNVIPEIFDGTEGS